MPQNDDELVYSTDATNNSRCLKCKKLLSACICVNQKAQGNTKGIKAIMRLEKAHRGGKEVTIIDRLPPHEEFLKKLSATLKKQCGCGGTYKIEENCGLVEIQGNKLSQIKNELLKQGISCK